MSIVYDDKDARHSPKNPRCAISSKPLEFPYMVWDFAGGRLCINASSFDIGDSQFGFVRDLWELANANSLGRRGIKPTPRDALAGGT